MGGSSKEQVVAYKYYEDQHIVLALSNFDFISHIWFANKRAWIGQATGAPDAWTEINIDKPGLFGGEKREGGVSGRIHIGMGWPDQPRLTRLVNRLGSVLMPAYRGVVSLYFDNFYFGNNPYIKELKVRAQAIHKLSDGSTQWYDEKAPIGQLMSGKHAIYIAIDTSGSMNVVTSNGQTRLDNTKTAVNGFLDYLGNSVAFTHIDIHIVGWDGAKATEQRRQVNSEDISELKTFVNNLSTNVSVTDFSLAVEDAADFFAGAPSSARRTVVFATDGEPYVPGTELTDAELAQNAADILFATANVHSYAFSIDLEDTTYTAYMDNTPNDGVPVIPGSNPDAMTSILRTVMAGIVDINPIHFIRECHTDRIWGGRYPDTKMGSSYDAAADTIYDEGLGVSFLFTEEIRWKEIIEEVARHIDAIPYQDPDTGLMEIKLIRDDYDIETLPVLDPSNSDLEQINNPFDNEVFNKVIVEFWNYETGKDDVVTLSDPAAIDMVGFINPKTYKYSGITNKTVAMMVAERDFARSNRPFYQGRVKTNRSVANLKPGSVFKLRSPEDGITEIICRVTKRQESGLLNGDIRIEFGEDIFSKVYSTFSRPQEALWEDPVGDPQQFSHQTVFEIPYYLVVKDQGESATANLNSDVCFFGFAGVEPESGAHIDYDLYVYPDGTTQPPDLEFAITAAFTPYAIVSADVDDPNVLTIPVEPLIGMDSVRIGQILLVGDGSDDTREVLSVAAEVADDDTTLTVNRGLIDTTPKPISAGTVLYFVETFYGGSETQYMPSEIVEGYGTPTNGAGVFAGPYTYHDLEMTGRFNKPYPPGDLRLDGIPLPQDYSPSASTVVITWHYRDRVLQSDQPIHFFDTADYGPESGTTYRIEADSLDSSGDTISANWLSLNVGLVKTYTLDMTANPLPVGTVTVRIKVWAVRDGIDSLQPAEAYFSVLAAPENITAEYQAATAPTGLSAVEV
jgi:hypothetical protein